MATERYLHSEGTDGLSLGGGYYAVWLTVDYRPNGSAFLLFGEIDNTKRFVETHFRFSGQGVETIEGVCPAGGTLRIPETGQATGLRMDGGRAFSITVW